MRRALRLLIRSALHSIPGVLDRAAFSTPARFTRHKVAELRPHIDTVIVCDVDSVDQEKSECLMSEPDSDNACVMLHTLLDIESIKQLKARYFRFLDTREWDRWSDLFAADCEFTIARPAGWAGPWTADQSTVGAEGFVAMVRELFRVGGASVHHGHMPEIEIIDAHHARGIWAMFDYIERAGYTKQGYGHFHEEYVKGDDGAWRISSLRLTRLREDVLPASLVQEG